MSVRCPACNAEVIVPTIRNLSKLPVVEEETGTKSKRATTGDGKSWSLPLGIFAAACLLVLCYCGWQGGMIVAGRYNDREAIEGLEKWGTKQELEYGDEMVAQYSNADLWDVWHTYRSDGLASKNPPEFVAAKKYYDEEKQRMYWMFGIAGVALLGIVTASVAGRAKS